MDIIKKLNTIIEMQLSEGFILVGFYLNGKNIQKIKHILSSGNKLAGYIGRFQNIPVYEIEKNLPDDSCKRYFDVVYQYVKMAIVD